jgi:hypothetical protein
VKFALQCDDGSSFFVLILDQYGVDKAGSLVG